MMITEKCIELNRKIHNPIFLNNFLKINEGDHERAFTSLDVIGDCQNAIIEFNELSEKHFPDRSTLYIYGILQVLYCQQDGAYHLYRTIKDSQIKNISDLFSLYKFDKEIREVRDDIAGHPVDRKRGKEFYFISKMGNTKFNFSYAGYTPTFKKVNVNLLEFITKQEHFINELLHDIDECIDEKIKEHKQNFKDIKLLPFIDELNHQIVSFYNGIHQNKSDAKYVIDEISSSLNNLKKSLNERYNNDIPEGISYILKLTDHITEKIKTCIDNNEFSNNLYADVFLDSFTKQIDELKCCLKEIDKDFETVK